MKRHLLRLRFATPLLLLLLATTPASSILFYSLLPWNGAGKATFFPPRPINPADIGVPCGYCIEPVAVGLTYPSGVAMDDQDRVYVVEAGYSYGEDFQTPRL